MKYNYIIDQWKVWPGHQYRLVEVGYRDSSSPQVYYVLETLSNDTQGEQCWVETVHQTGRDITNILAKRLKELHARHS